MIGRVKKLFSTRGRGSGRKLRRQPKLRRVESGSAFRVPNLQVPRTARKRRRRNHAAFRLPITAIKKIILSARWVSLFLLVICVLALVMVGMDRSFYLTNIPVEGVASIPPAEIVETSGLAGVHIFAANPGEAARKIAAIPGVISATVTLAWPDSAYIRVREDSPIAVWEQGGEKYWVNASGKLVPARVDVPGLLHIRIEDTETPETVSPSSAAEVEGGETTPAKEQDIAVETLPFVPQEVLQGALQLRELRPNIDVLNYDISGGLSYQDGRGWRVYFGTGNNMAQKLAVYETLVEHLLAAEETPVYISVSNQEKPFYLVGGS